MPRDTQYTKFPLKKLFIVDVICTDHVTFLNADFEGCSLGLKERFETTFGLL